MTIEEETVAQREADAYDDGCMDRDELDESNFVEWDDDFEYPKISYPSRNDAWQRITERAFLVDPERTFDDLVEAGESSLAARLRVDYQTGRLAENTPAPRSESPSGRSLAWPRKARG